MFCGPVGVTSSAFFYGRKSKFDGWTIVTLVTNICSIIIKRGHRHGIPFLSTDVAQSRLGFVQLYFDSNKSRISLGDGTTNPPAPDEEEDDDGDGNGDDDGEVEASGRTRYAFANRCVVIQSAENDKFIVANNGLYGATAESFAEADAFYFKPTSLGDYLLYNRAGQLVSVANGVGMNTLAAATDNNIFTVRVAGDNTQYVQPPVKDREPTLAEITAYRSFNDPKVRGELFTFDSAASNQRLGVNESGQLAQGASAQQFKLHKATGCAEFPEANNNAEGKTFKGTTEDGRVLGMADVHVHLTATNF